MVFVFSQLYVLKGVRTTIGGHFVISTIALSVLFVSQIGEVGAVAAAGPAAPAMAGAEASFAPATPPAPAIAPVGMPEGPPFATAAMPAPSDLVTREEMQAELAKTAWRKGDFSITPYGILWGSMSYDSQRAKIGDYALWFESPDLHPGDADFNVDAKSTRIGLDLAGPSCPTLCDAKIAGKIEVDFQGQFVTRNKPGVLLRHAYIEAKNGEFRWLIGQTWDVISPLYIPTLNYTAGSAVGNLAYRRAQFRGERYLAFSERVMLTLQASINGNVVTDFVTDSASTTSADPGPYPDFQARAAVTLGRREDPDLKPIVFGVGGHYGIQDFDFRTDPIDLDNEVLTYSLAADLVVPISTRFGVQCEFFTGYNLSNYMGGILQGVDRVTHEGIRATGGWIDLYADWTPSLHTHCGFSIDDPLDQDMTSGRTHNQMFFSNVLWNATEHLLLGFEVDVWETGFMNLDAGKGVRLEFATKYAF